MKASVIIRIYTKGESRNAMNKALYSGIEYSDAVLAVGAMIKTLRITGWETTSCPRGEEMAHYASGLKFENYSGETMIIKIKENNR